MKIRDLFELFVFASQDNDLWQYHYYDAAARYFGMTKIGHGSSSYVYRARLQGVEVVFKFSNYYVNRPALNYPSELKAVWLKPIFVDEKVMVQPLADCSNIKQLGKFSYRLYSDLLNKYQKSYDVHDENVGIYRGREIVFDC